MHRLGIGQGSLLLFFGLAYGLTWAAWLPMVRAFPKATFLHPLGGLGPLLAALLTARITRGRDGLHEVVASATRWRIGARGYFVALCLPFTLLAMATLAQWLVTRVAPHPALLLETREFGRIGLWYWLVLILFYGFGEEVGWRGFALPRLMEAGLCPAKASALFSVLWALWHLPLFFYSSLLGSMGFPMIVGWYLSLLLSSYLLTYLWLSFRRSVLLVALFHGAVDIVVTTRATEGLAVVLVNMLLLAMGLTVILRLGPGLGGDKELQKG